ncbi:MAG TPA: dTMP kinase [Wenzhouxiangella sp.]|nr:dTMP kinase [Wenzhouxiangella sp.]
MSRGRLITLEGGEGAGKTTVLHSIRAWLERHGSSVVVTREPGGTDAAEKIRALLLDPGTGTLDPLTELLLMFAARQENLSGVIRPSLEAGHDVICDRFTDASRAYQGGGRQLGPGPVEALVDIVHPDLEPDLTLLLDVPVDIGLARVRNRGGSPDRMERNHSEFLQRVRDAYLELAARAPDRISVVDANRPLAEVIKTVEQTLEEKLL